MMVLPLLAFVMGMTPSPWPGDQMAQLAEARPVPMMAAVCSPIGPIRDQAAAILSLAAQQAEMGKFEVPTETLQKFTALDLEAVGVPASGTLTVTLSGYTNPSFDLGIDFQGTMAQASFLLEQLGMKTDFRGPMLAVQAKKATGRAWIEDQRLWLHLKNSDGASPGQAGTTSSAPSLPPELWHHLPPGNGCALFVRNPKATDSSNEFTGLTMFFPLGGGVGEAVVRIAFPAAERLTIEVPTGHPTLGNAPPAPLGVMTLGVAPGDVLRTLMAIKGKKFPEELENIPLRVLPGLSYGVFPPASGRNPSLAAVVPVRRVSGLPIRGSRLARALERGMPLNGGVGFTRTGRRSLEFEKKGMLLYVRTSRNLIWLSDSELLLGGIMAGAGEPWGGETHEQAAREWPLSFTFSLPLPSLPSVGSSVGVKVHHGYLEMDFGSEMGAGQVAVVGMLAAVAIPNFVAMQLRAKRSELPSVVSSLVRAEKIYYAEHEAYLPLEPTPRPVGALSKESVPWVPTEATAALGFSYAGEVRGTYWIELSEDGTAFTVHGMADIDGDGTPCHFVAEVDGAPTMATPASVY